MSESFQLHGLPCSSNLFFFFALHFYPNLFCIFALLSIKGYTIFSNHGSGDSSRMHDALSLDGFSVIRGWTALESAIY